MVLSFSKLLDTLFCVFLIALIYFCSLDGLINFKNFDLS